MVQVSMSMAIPSFLFFSIYCIVNVYLPIFFRNMDYTATSIGFLLSLFEISGIIFTFVLCKFPEKTGKYGKWMLILGLFLIVMPFPLLLSTLPITVCAIILYAIPVKAYIPISDTFINLRLGDRSEKYGTIRAFGSLGFVAMSLLMQYTVDSNTITQFQSVLWTSIPAVFMCISILAIPKLMKPFLHTHADEQTEVLVETKSSIQSKSFFKQFSPQYWLIIVVITFGNLGQFGPQRFFSLYVKEYLHSDSFGLLWAISVLFEIPALFFSYKFIRKFGSKNLILFAVGMISVRAFMYVLFPSLTGAAFAQVLHAITFGLLHPASVVFIAEEVRGTKNGVLGQAISTVGSAGIATVLGSFAGGIIIDAYGYLQLYTIFGFIPLIGLVVYFLLRKKVGLKSL